jgi:SHS2 domain-containing protein
MKAIMSGFEEIQHTADWAVKIWAVSPEGLFITALKAMYQLMNVSSKKPSEKKFISIDLESENLEGLLVAFLSECHYYQESEMGQLEPVEISIQNNHLKAKMKFRQINSISKEIKAVTFHNLNIDQQPSGLSAILIFDV